MKQLKACFLVLALLAWEPAFALPADHPANPEMAVPAFQPADYFAGQSGNMKLAADEHQHDTAPAARESGAKDEAAHEHEESAGKGCKRGEGMGCCCQCCCKCGGEKGDMMKMMNKKGMQQDSGKPVVEPVEQPATKQEEGHESHH